MKKIPFLLVFTALFVFYSCGEKAEKKEEKKIKLEKKVEKTDTNVNKDTNAELIALGKKLFTEKDAYTLNVLLVTDFKSASF